MREVRPSSARSRVTTRVGKLSKTKQAMKDQCNINLIMERHRQTGIIDHVNAKTPTYGDFSQAGTLHDAVELVNASREHFMSLPARVRALCDNNPEIFLRALADEDQTELLADAGLEMPDGWEPRSPEETPPPEVTPNAPENENPPKIEGGE